MMTMIMSINPMTLAMTAGKREVNTDTTQKLSNVETLNRLHGFIMMTA